MTRSLSSEPFRFSPGTGCGRMDGGNDLGDWFTSGDYVVVFLIPGSTYIDGGMKYCRYDVDCEINGDSEIATIVTIMKYNHHDFVLYNWTFGNNPNDWMQVATQQLTRTYWNLYDDTAWYANPEERLVGSLWTPDDCAMDASTPNKLMKFTLVSSDTSATPNVIWDQQLTTIVRCDTTIASIDFFE